MSIFHIVSPKVAQKRAADVDHDADYVPVHHGSLGAADARETTFSTQIIIISDFLFQRGSMTGLSS